MNIISFIAYYFYLILNLNASNLKESKHTNNWAVIVSASRYWFNYRHMANALSMYRTVKRLGIPDSNIILMLADDIACNPRNVYPGKVFNNKDHRLELYGQDVQVDYRGYDVTAETFIRLLTGRLPDSTPKYKRLQSDENSNVLIYMTGHGGDKFLKFQDNHEISAQDFGDAIEQMWQKKRYKEILFMIDTCEANTMYSTIYSPNVLSVGSSPLGKKSYSHHLDEDLGVTVIDRFTYYSLEFLENIKKDSKATLDELFNSYNPQLILSDPGISTENFNRSLSETLITDFFGNVQQCKIDELTKDQFDSIKLDEEVIFESLDSYSKSPTIELPSESFNLVDYLSSLINYNTYKFINLLEVKPNKEEIGEKFWFLAVGCLAIYIVL
ncbi:hypothetical protein CONCODRAFT_5827 [Conidiobolus coronatus NRRL 28638]|uniref:GPI-anchor transamidase n=1 Tax=Conidiobolus coronatus (strain ATCC 28846 / CBS 209.66 / NRRL 28638) TaxID=796925 RepID=A0A137P959_CONC2|nr:hypothetical protein CONCODRAFT_5827 [Conidiobolus coronatus NRRL 28638]|eukprot:KXN71484.1 hypothetical protein CONCODRAFT_5827 [Conidiobolus coronatus NRRL 28638]